MRPMGGAAAEGRIVHYSPNVSIHAPLGDVEFVYPVSIHATREGRDTVHFPGADKGFRFQST